MFLSPRAYKNISERLGGIIAEGSHTRPFCGKLDLCPMRFLRVLIIFAERGLVNDWAALRGLIYGVCSPSKFNSVKKIATLIKKRQFVGHF